MGRRIAWILLSFLFISGDAFPETPSVSYGNYLRYGDGREEFYDYSRHKTYIENEAELELSWKNTIAGVRYDYRNPAEFTPDRNTLKKYNIEYRRDSWNLKAGTFSDLFGRGMAFNAYEEKKIGHDSEISGLRATYLTDDSAVHVIGGQLEYEQIPDFTQTIDIKVAGLNLQRRVRGGFFLGGSFLRNEVSQVPGFFRDTFFMNIAELSGEYKGETLQFLASATSNENESSRIFNKGNVSSYLSASLSKGPLGMSLEYKNYRFGLTTPDLSGQSFRHRRLLPTQNPPACVREYSWTFLSRRSTGIDFNDEVGLLLDAYYAIRPGTTFNLSGSLASGHFDYERVAGGYRRIDSGPSWLPSTEKEYSPYWQIYSDIEHYFENGSMLNAGVAYTCENNYNFFYPDREELVRMATVPVHSQIILSPRYALQCTAEYQYFKETLYSRDWFSNGILTLGLSRAPSLNFSVVAELLEGNAKDSQKKNWVYGSASWRFRSRQYIEIGYGEARGGMSCTNGICRFVQPFKGFRLTATNSF